jgi:hypothetical protein
MLKKYRINTEQYRNTTYHCWKFAKPNEIDESKESETLTSVVLLFQVSAQSNAILQNSTMNIHWTESNLML